MEFDEVLRMVAFHMQMAPNSDHGGVIEYTFECGEVVEVLLALDSVTLKCPSSDPSQ